MPRFPILHGSAGNEAGGYICLETVSHYIRHSAQRAGIGSAAPGHTAFDRVAAEAAGVRIGKFHRLLDRWLRLEVPIPMGFLTAIRVKTPTLIHLFEHDRDRFELALGRVRHPQRLILQFVPGVLHDVELPKGMSEREAIAHAQSIASERHCTAILHYPELLTIKVDASKAVTARVFSPNMRIHRDFVVFSKRGGAINGLRLS